LKENNPERGQQVSYSKAKAQILLAVNTVEAKMKQGIPPLHNNLPKTKTTVARIVVSTDTAKTHP
jgi:uncharacterized protein (DUF885 family)